MSAPGSVRTDDPPDAATDGAVVLADSNALRDPDLAAYLAAHPGYRIALSDLTRTEMLKKNALLTARNSLRVVARYPEQTLALKPTDALLDVKVKSAADASRLFDPSETHKLRALSLDLQMEPEPPELARRMTTMEADAMRRHGLLKDQVRPMAAGLVDAAKDFSRGEIAELRIGKTVSDATRDKLLALLKQTVREFILTNQDPLRRSPMTFAEAAQMFGFRYSLCVTIYYVLWVQGGRQTALALERRVNDVVDLQVAALGTFFSGVISKDQRLQQISANTRKILRDWNAYVGPDLRTVIAATAQAAP